MEDLLKPIATLQLDCIHYVHVNRLSGNTGIHIYADDFLHKKCYKISFDIRTSTRQNVPSDILMLMSLNWVIAEKLYFMHF